MGIGCNSTRTLRIVNVGSTPCGLAAAFFALAALLAAAGLPGLAGAARGRRRAPRRRPALARLFLLVLIRAAFFPLVLSP